MIKKKIELRTVKNIEMISIMQEIQNFIKENNILDGKINVFVPHTTAGATINENSDPSVQYDINKAISEIFPDTINVMHDEGNSASHLMSSIIGVHTYVFVENGKLLLGQWQSVYFWEFDGPRARKYILIYDK
jgi:secondary thiamine-phosphate synthase enzyme